MPERILFVTGKLAEPALRRLLTALAPKVGFQFDIAVMPITVAALLTTDWVGKRLRIPQGVDRILLPGHCRGPLSSVTAQIPVERGPVDLRQLPEYFGTESRARLPLEEFDIEILAEINHAPDLSLQQLLKTAYRLRSSGADVIDLGCQPGSTWSGIGEAVARLRAEGIRVSVDSFNPVEVEAALQAGAELVLSVNGSNRHHGKAWYEKFGAEVVAIPDSPTDVESLDQTVDRLVADRVPFRIDPILEPLGYGFAASLGRYLETRKKYPSAQMMMGVGNLTELTDVDSAGINVLLAGFCQELGIRSVLTTEVINWCRTSVRELDLARRLVFHSVREAVLPKNLSDELILFRDPRLYELGPDGLAQLARDVTDRNYRIFAERGEIHVINGEMYIHGFDPFELFREMQKRDSRLDPDHAFYLGYEMCKAVTALTTGKNYTQDQALRWGFLTVPEKSHRNPPH